MNEWKPIATAPMNLAVATKIDDAFGPRNEQPLIQKRRDEKSQPLWWFPDMSMYVYYTPTHWRHL